MWYTIDVRKAKEPYIVYGGLQMYNKTTRVYNRTGSLGKEKMQELANKVFSLSGLIKSIGYPTCAGGTAGVVKKYLKLYNINTDHWTGQGWNKGMRMKDWSNYSGHQNVKKQLIKERGIVCESCKLKEWLDLKIPIEIHHIDGDRTNNTPTNLQLLCPNCHSITDNWRGRNIKQKC